MNPLSIFGGLSAALGISDILGEGSVERAMRLAREAEVRRQEQERSRRSTSETDQRRRSDLEAQLKSLATKLARTPPEQRPGVLDQIRRVESQIAAEDFSAQARFPQQGAAPGEVRKPGQPAPTPQPALIEEQLEDVSRQLEQARDRNEPPEKVFVLELKQDFLRQALSTARENPLTARSQPAVTDGMTASEVRSELAQIDWALEELGTGYELATDPEKLALAHDLRQERDRLLFQLAKADTAQPVRTGENQVAGEAAQTAASDASLDPWESKDPKIKAFLARYYAESGQFPEVKRPDPALVAKNATHERASRLADSLAVELGIIPPGDGQPLSDDDRQELGKLRAAAFNQLHQNVDRPNMLEAAKSGLMQQVLQSDQGTQLLRNEVSQLVQEGRQAGAFEPTESEQLDRLLRNTFDPDLKKKVSQVFVRNPKADLKQVAKEVFLDASRQAQQRAGGRGAIPAAAEGPPQGTGQSLRRALAGGGRIPV